jgi:DNA helicase HerA-like ATPase
MAVRIECLPQINSDVLVGGQCKQSVWLGRTVDSGRPRVVRFDANENFVVLEVGKRGSGKSFGLGSALEAFATQDQECSIASHGPNRRGVLLLDPLDVHWTAIYPVREASSGPMREQFKLVSNWQGGNLGKLTLDAINVDVYMPAGQRKPEDPKVFRDFFLPIADMTAADFALLYGVNLFNDPAGMLLAEIHDKVTRQGYTLHGQTMPPTGVFGLRHLTACLQDDDIQANYAAQTIRAVRQRLLSWQRDPLFQKDTGTPVTELVRPGRLSILCLNRLSEDMRSVIASVVVRKIKAERTRSSQMERRLAFDRSAAPDEGPAMPRTILAIDEAQMILPASTGGHARAAIESYVLEGRNFGLSIWMATQRPRGAISERAVSQLDSLIVHKLSTADDLAAVEQLLQSTVPQAIKINDRVGDVQELIRSLEVGMALISCDTTTAGRAFVVEMRPRVVAHGGKAF